MNKRASLVDSVTIALREFINSDQIKLGEKLPSEQKLCEMYKVSRTTIREALRMLQATGFVEFVPNKGAFVLNKGIEQGSEAGSWMLLHAPEVLEVLLVREVLEPFAVRLAVENGSNAEIYAIKGIALMFQAAAEKEDKNGMVDLDEKFHEAIMIASHNEFIMDIATLMSNALRGFRGRTFAIDKNGKHCVKLHNDIADSIVSRDAEAAAKYMQRHMRSNIDIVKQYSY